MTASEVTDPFDTRRIETVAGEFSVDPSRLAELVSAHQELMAGSPGVDNLVYEWRKQFGATVLARTDDWYFVGAPAWTWEEFGNELDATDAERDALTALHARIVVSRRDVSHSSFEDATPMVLHRE